MADRQSVLKPPPPRPELESLVERARQHPITNEQLQEQRVSFAYGNAPAGSDITKDSARRAADGLLMSRRA